MRDWVRAHRGIEEAERLLSALQRIHATLRRFPGIGASVAERPDLSVRVIALGRLPYLVWYGYEVDDPAAPVWLVSLRHEKQDRERFDPSRFDGP